MPLLEMVEAVCRRLAPLGWGELLGRQDIQLDSSDLESELNKPVNVQKDIPGFEDFGANSGKGIEPGTPGLSLLYHALASPRVHPTLDGRPSDKTDAYPTLEELDTIENYIFSLSRRSISDFTSPVVAVFAYQYRTGPRSPHGIHADIAFSRTGVARVGAHSAHYDPRRRGFWVLPPDGSELICVMPARYGAFLAEERVGAGGASILGHREPQDQNRRFLVPVHKLFPGTECLRGKDLTITFEEFHVAEKLRRVHKVGGVEVISGFDLDRPPFVRDSTNSRDLVSLEIKGASVIAVPVPHDQIVRTATQRNSSTGRDEIVRFRVPPESEFSRFWTSMELPVSDGRNAPEYVNIRQEVITSSAGRQSLRDINQLPEPTFRKKLRDGGYEAAHFVDDSCDGCIAVRVEGLGTNIMTWAAFSLVTAPDFFPLCDQTQVEKWALDSGVSLSDHFAQGGPQPLCEERLAANPGIHLPGSGTRAFDQGDKTLTTVVGPVPATQGLPSPSVEDGLVSFLPDGASGVFAPGWDVAQAALSQGGWLASYGLGSPFPEDAKLCAALNSFWPAVAPDASSTFGRTPTGIPMLDEELGLHPDHSQVRNGSLVSVPGWDGEFGPFFEQFNGALHVNYANRDRSDYVRNVLAGGFRISTLASVDAQELIRRMNALRQCIRNLPPLGDKVSSTLLLLVSVRRIENWANQQDRGSQQLTGPGYWLEFAQRQGNEIRTTDLRRLRRRVAERFVCHISNTLLVASRQVPNQPPSPFGAPITIPALGF